MDTNNVNTWVEEVLNSTEGIAKAGPSDKVWGLLERRIKIPVSKGRTISLNIVSAAAACIILLLSVNIYVAQKHMNAKGKPTDQIQDIVQYYDITNDKDISGI